MSATLFLTRLHRLRPSLSLNLSTPIAASIYQLLSATTTQAPSPNPQFAVDYLVRSCGLPSDDAIRASKRIQHLNSPDKPDAVLHFLRQTGISESDIKTALSRDPRLLFSNVENNWRPNVAKLQYVGLSLEDISGMISRSPLLFRFNFVPKIDFWMRALGSAENVSLLLTRKPEILRANLEKVVMPNVSFLQEQCGLSVCQIVRLIKISLGVISVRPETLEINAKRAEKLGVPRVSGMFIYALAAVSWLNQSAVEAKLLHLKSLGLSHEEVTLLISKAPGLLKKSEEAIGRNMEFLIKEVGCDKLVVVRNPSLLTYNLEKRLMARNIVRKLLLSKGLPVADNAFVSFVQINEKQFLQKFVLPYEQTIPGLHQAYADACSGKTGAMVRILQ